MDKTFKRDAKIRSLSTISVNSSVKPPQIKSNSVTSAIRNEGPWNEVEMILK